MHCMQGIHGSSKLDESNETETKSFHVETESQSRIEAKEAKEGKEGKGKPEFQSNVFSQTKCKQKADSDSVMAASVQGQVTIEGIALSCAAVMSSKMKSLVK